MVYGFGGADVDDLDFSVDSFGQAGKDPAWPDFIEIFDAVGNKLFHTPLPEYRLDKLLYER